MTLPEVPATIGERVPDPESARSAPAGAIELVACENCALIWNVAFDESVLEYGSAYENSQMFSPRFRAYAEELAAELVARYSLRGGRVVEIGCGKGEFLHVLASAGVIDAVGFDASYDGEVDDDPHVSIRRELYGAGPVPPADLLLSRHVVEHLVDPVGVLSSLRDAVTPATTPLYVEVPDARFVFAGGGMWDVIYPHVSYFSPPSMSMLLRCSGWAPASVEARFEGQFLAAHATPGPVESQLPEPAAVEPILDAADGFGRRVRAAIDRWADELDQRASAGPIALWGAGSKGVTFLSIPALGRHITGVVDVNERKHGTYIPRTAHRSARRPTSWSSPRPPCW
ncbi:MAG: class I SAM-dependent methyltransferase [Acidimicrobiia bacterium]|nr:class I SAM-dependent methyltransferase [Acidimicrobiia bacterium]